MKNGHNLDSKGFVTVLSRGESMFIVVVIAKSGPRVKGNSI